MSAHPALQTRLGGITLPASIFCDTRFLTIVDGFAISSLLNLRDGGGTMKSHEPLECNALAAARASHNRLPGVARAMSHLLFAAVISSIVAQRTSATVYSTLDDPLTANGGNALHAVSGNLIVGEEFFTQTGHHHAFLYNGSTFTQLDDPNGVDGGAGHGVSGNTVVGEYYITGGKPRGFIYNGSTYSNLTYP